MKQEYRQQELGQGVRGNYCESYKRRHNVVKLDPAVSEVFPDDDKRQLSESIHKIVGDALKKR